MANVKFIAVSRSLSGILDYVTNREKTVDSLISGVNCVAETAQAEFEAVKNSSAKRTDAVTITSSKPSPPTIRWTSKPPTRLV